MNKSSLLSLSLLLSPLALAQETVKDVVKPDGKLSKYHEVLQKRPESANLFQRFQTNWLAKHDEQSLENFLRSKSDTGSAADKQIYAYFLMQKGKEIEAMKVLSAALVQDPKNAQAHLDRAKAYSRMLDFDKAVLDVEKALQLKNDNDAFLLNANKLKGRYLTRQGKADEAIQHWSELAKANKNDQELIEDVIDILMGDGLFEAALEHATQLRDNTRDPYKKALRTLRVGDILQKRGERDKALSVYEETLKLSGSGSWLEREIVAQLETIFRKEDNLTGLSAKLQTLSKNYPQRIQIAQKYADVLSENEEHKKAQEVYRDIIKRSPNDKELKKAFLRILEKANDHESAKELVNSLIQLSPQDADLHVTQAENYHKLGQKEQVLEQLKTYYKKVNKSAATALRYASLLNKYNFKQETEAAYAMIQKDYADNVEALFSVANHYLFTQEKAKAEAIWKKLSQTKDADVISRLLDSLLFNAQEKLALEIVQQRKESFKTNKSFLPAALKVAEVNNEDELALKFARSILHLAEKPAEIDTGIQQMARLIVKFNKVEASLAELKDKKEKSISDQFLYVRLLDEAGDDLAAEKMLEQLAKSDDIASLQQSVRLYQRRYELDKAANLLEKITSLPGGLKSVYLKQLNHVYQRSGRNKKALATIRKWKTLTPNDKNAWLEEVELLESVEGATAALEALRRGLERFEDDVEIHSRLAALYKEDEKYVQAKQLYWRLYDEAKDITERMQWAGALADVAKLDGTTAELVDALTARRRNSPKAIAPIMALAEVYRSQNKTEERRNLLLEATRLRPDDATLFIEIAQSYNRNGKVKKAVSALLEAQKVDKSDHATRLLAKIYMDEGDYERGLDELEKLHTAGNDARGVEALVLTLLKQEAIDQAETYLKKSILKFPNDWRLQLLSCLVDYEMGYVTRSYNKALTLLEVDTEIQGLTNGWKLEDRTQLGYNTVVDYKRLSLGHRQAMAAPALFRIFNEITGSNSQHNYFIAGPQSASRGVLPIESEGLRFFVKLHLVRLIADSSGKEKEEMIAKVKESGVTRLDLWLETAKKSLNQRGYNQQIAGQGFFESRLKDDFYLDLKLLNQFATFNFEVDAKTYTRVEERMKSANGYIAEILPYFIKSGTSSKVQLAKVEKVIEREKVVSDLSLMAIFNSMRDQFNGGTMPKLDSKVAGYFKRYIDENEQYRSKKQINFQQRGNMKQQMLMWVEMLLLMDLFQGDDYAPVVAVIEEDKLSALAQMGGMGGFGRNQQQPALSYPPKGLKTVSAAQLAYFQEEGANFMEVAVSSKKLEKHLDKFKNPVLRVVASLFCNKKANVMPLLDEAIKQDKYQADALLLKATLLYEREDKMVEALDLLEQAREVSLNRGQREMLDHYLAFLPLEGDPKKNLAKLSEKQQEASKSAARRLMLSRKVTQVQQIESLLKGLGMEKEESRFLTKNRQVIRQAKPASGGLVGQVYQSVTQASNATEPYEKVKELFESKKTDQAVKYAAKTLRTYLKNQSNNNYYIKQVVEAIQKAGKQAEVIERLSPGDSVSPRRWLAYYEVAKVLEDKKAQKKAVDFLSKLPTTPQSVKVPLALALYQTEPERSLTLLERASDNSAVMAGLSKDLKAAKMKPADYVKVLEFTARYTEHLEKEKIQSDYQFNQFFRVLLHAHGYETYGDGLKVIPAKDKKLRKRFDNASDKIIRYALKNSSSAEDAFRMLYKKSLADKSTDKMVEVAVRSIVDIAELSPHYYANYGYNGRESKYPTRDEFIISQMIKQKNVNLITKEQIEKLKNSNFELAEKFTHAQENVLVSEEEFNKRLKVLAEAKTLDPFVKWHELVAMRKQKSSQLKFAADFFGFLTKKFEENSNVDLSKLTDEGYIDHEEVGVLFHTSLNNLAKYNDLSTAANLLDELAAGVADEKEKHKAWIKSISQAQMNGRLNFANLYQHIFQTLAVKPETAAFAVRKANEHEFPVYRVDDDELLDAKQWFESYKKMGYLNTPDKLKLQRLDLVKLDTIKLDQWNGRHIDEDDYLEMPRFDFEFLAKSIEDMEYEQKNKEEYNKLIKMFKEVKGSGKYSADLFLVFADELEVDDFFQKHKNTIINAPAEHKKDLVYLFRVDESDEARSALKSFGILDHLSYDKEKANAEIKEKAKAFFEQKAPLQRNALYTLNKDTVSLLKNNIANDEAFCHKVLDKYIELVKGSPASKDVYRTDKWILTPIEAALANEVFSRLRYQSIYPKDSLKLVYYLSKREDWAQLGITNILEYTMPALWPEQKQYKNRNHGVKSIMAEYAEIYKSIEDKEYKEFFMTAWFIYHAKNEYHKQLLFYLLYRRNVLDQLKGKDPIKDEFYTWMYECDYVNRVCYMDTLYAYKANKYKPHLRLKNVEAYKTVLTRMGNKIEVFSPKHRLFMAQGMLGYTRGFGVASYSSKFLNELVSSYGEMVELDSDNACAPEAMYVLGMIQYLNTLEPEVKQSVLKASQPALEAAIRHMENGGSFRRMHYENLCTLVSKSEGGVEFLAQMIDKKPQYFDGMTAVAHIFLMGGKYDEVLKILPPHKVCQSVGSYTRLWHNSEYEKHTDKLLTFYKTPEQKAAVYAQMILPDVKYKKLEHSTHFERVTKLAELIKAADPTFAREQELETAYRILMENMHVDAAKVIDGYYQARRQEFTVEQMNTLVEQDDTIDKARRRAFCQSVRHAVAIGDTAFIKAHIENADQILNESKKVVTYNQAIYVDNLIDGFMSSFYELFAKEENDQRAIHLLEVYRDLCSLEMKIEDNSKYKKTKEKWWGVSYSQLLVPYVHSAVGKYEDYHSWNEKSVSKFWKKLNREGVWMMVFRFADRTSIGSKYRRDGHKGLFATLPDTQSIILRVLNTKEFQENVVTHFKAGGAIDYMRDYGYISSTQGYNLLTQNEIEIKVPSFEGILERDKAHFACLMGNKAKAIDHFAEMFEILEAHPCPNRQTLMRAYFRAPESLISMSEYEKAKTIIPQSIVDKFKPRERKQYKAIHARADKAKRDKDKY